MSPHNENLTVLFIPLVEVSSEPLPLSFLMSFSWQRRPQKNSIYELGLPTRVCIGQDLPLYLARTRDIQQRGGGRTEARCHSCWGIIKPSYRFRIIVP